MKKLLLVSLCALSLHSSFAADTSQFENVDTMGNPTQTSISGDDLCGGQKECTTGDLQNLFKRVIPPVIEVSMVLGVGAMLLLLLNAKWQEVNGNAGALAEARKKMGQAIIGFCMLVAIISGLYLTALKTLGVDVKFLNILNFFSIEFIPHAYAANMLPNTTTSTNVFDLIINLFNLFMRFFVYPGVIFFWVLSGFKFISSQGNPEGLKTARGWLWTTLIVTVVVFTFQAFLLAAKGTVTNIVGDQSAQTSTANQGGNTGLQGAAQNGGQSSPQSSTQSNCPATGGSPGTCCQKGGYYGQFDVNGVCVVGGMR